MKIYIYTTIYTNTNSNNHGDLDIMFAQFLLKYPTEIFLLLEVDVILRFLTGPSIPRSHLRSLPVQKVL